MHENLLERDENDIIESDNTTREPVGATKDLPVHYNCNADTQKQ